MKSQNFDGVEQRIHNVFSQITVDTEGLKTKMRNLQNTKPKRYTISFVTAIAIVLLLMAITATVGATSIGLPQFLSRLTPTFGEFAIPPEYPAYDVQDGIRIEVIGAQQIGNVVLVYITMQDETGQNRISRDTWPDLRIYREGQVGFRPSTARMLRYDRGNNRVYFEKIIYGEIGVPRPNILELVVSSILDFSSEQTQTICNDIYLDNGSANVVWRMQVSTSDAGEYITWSGIQVGDVYIENMILTPMALSINGLFKDAMNVPCGDWIDIEIEREGRWRNIQLFSRTGGWNQDGFRLSFPVDSPIDVAAVTAVYVNDVRIER